MISTLPATGNNVQRSTTLSLHTPISRIQIHWILFFFHGRVPIQEFENFSCVPSNAVYGVTLPSERFVTARSVAMVWECRSGSQRWTEAGGRIRTRSALFGHIYIQNLALSPVLYSSEYIAYKAYPRCIPICRYNRYMYIQELRLFIEWIVNFCIPSVGTGWAIFLGGRDYFLAMLAKCSPTRCIKRILLILY